MYIPGTFQTAAPALYLGGVACSAVSLKVGSQFPMALPALPAPPEVSLLIFKVPGAKPH